MSEANRSRVSESDDNPIDGLSARFLALLMNEMDERGFDIDTGKILGQGGMSIVWAARRRFDKMDLAAKVYVDPEHHDLYATEVEALGKLSGVSSVVQLIDHGIAESIWNDGTLIRIPYLLVERAQTTLEDVLKERGALSIDEAAACARSIGTALDAAHGQGLLNQDVNLRTSSSSMRPGNLATSV